MERLSSGELWERLDEARRFQPKTAAGLWAKQDAVSRLESDLVSARQVEIIQQGQAETNRFNELAGLPLTKLK